VTPGLARVDAARIADAVEGLSEVSRLSGGPAGAVATYLPGNRVVGVRAGDNRVEIHVVAASMTTPLAEVALRVRSVVRPHVPVSHQIDVFIDDIEDPRDALHGGPVPVPDADTRPERGVWGGPERQPILSNVLASPPETRPEPSAEVPS